MDILTKMELDDIDGYDWNWTDKYLDEFVEDLTKAYMASYDAEFPDAPLERASPILLDAVQREAAEWAMEHGAEQIVAITVETKSRVQNLVKSGILSGHPVGRITNILQGDFIFSALRATRIARTETAIALGQGILGAAKKQERNEKRWITSGDALVSDDCMMNEGVKWIPIADPFPSGVSTIPQHPNCRCNVGYRTKELHDPDLGTIIGAVENNMRGDFRCPGCNVLLGRNVATGIRIHCRHCKAERIA
jgi:SPP1 gp7 family putative phage head morphogenesis protein